MWCDHAGVLVFAQSLLAIAQVLDQPEARFTQWLASLLLGALNIEQTKFLNWQDMAQLLGSVVRFRTTATGIGTTGDAGELSKAGLLQCKVLGRRRAERLLLRSAY